MSIVERPAPPWDAFLQDLDAALPEPVHLECLGGFVVTQFYGFARETNDVDFLSAEPSRQSALLRDLAGESRPLHRRHGVYLQRVTNLYAFPDSYEDRLIEMFPGAYPRLRLFALEAHDLVLTKLERHNARDREDALYLYSRGLISPATLQSRYDTEMRPYYGANVDHHDRTLRIWLEAMSDVA